MKQMAIVINSFAIAGIDGYQVEVETVTMYGQPSITIVGLGAREFLEGPKAALPETPLWGLSPATLKR